VSDVIVVGGGVGGLWLAYELSKPHLTTVVLDKALGFYSLSEAACDFIGRPVI